MPIPDFDDTGNLPPGIHRCQLAEVLERFGVGSSERETEAKELIQFIDWARGTGMARVLVNGSFVTDKHAPNDVDIILLPGPGEPSDPTVLLREEVLWPFLDIHVATDEEDLKKWALEDFGVDRYLQPKGIVEVIL